jgi:hypothetical protein
MSRRSIGGSLTALAAAAAFLTLVVPASATGSRVGVGSNALDIAEVFNV